MKPRTRLAAVCLASVLSGCAAISQTFDDNPGSKIYAGTRLDGAIIFSGFSGRGDASDWLGGFRVVIWFGCLVDLPFSLVADTVLLPYTVPKHFSSDQAETTASGR